jgi:acetylornithine/N-succinyldiaminopimelate aminotransferase
MFNSNILTTSWAQDLSNNYGSPLLHIVSGAGSYVFDNSNRRYLDLLGGIATNILGHCHPAIVKAIADQSSQLGHVSNFYSHPRVLALAHKLKEIYGDSEAKVFFSNSGTEANEAALKVSRLSGRSSIIATVNGFHGRTLGSLSLTGQESKRAPFRPLLKGISHIPFGDINAAKKKIGRKTAMVIVEPIQGEAGVIVPPMGYLKELRRITEDRGIILALDCVQTGMGRTGTWFGYENEEIRPDIVTLAKGLAAGLPIGATIISSKITDFSPGDHGSTFGANPIVCASALAAFEVIERENLLEKNSEKGIFLRSQLVGVPGIKEIRSAGLLIGIEFHEDVAISLRNDLQLEGFLVNACNPRTLRIAPPFIVTEKELTSFARALVHLLGRYHD